MEEVLFTPAAVLQLLTSIEELKDADISLSDVDASHIQISIGQSTYNISIASAAEVEVDNEVIDVVQEENEQAYDELANSEDVEVTDTTESGDVIESGIISGLVKSLLLGGMIRLAPKLLK